LSVIVHDESVFSIFDVRIAIVAQNKKDGQNYRTPSYRQGEVYKTCFDGCLYKQILQSKSATQQQLNWNLQSWLR